MRRFRNPRYAPESLERKLSPSGFTPPPAEVSAEGMPASSGPACDYSTANVDPPFVNEPCYVGDLGQEPPAPDLCSAGSPGDPNPGDPGYPSDPEGPAYSGDPALV